MVKFGVMQQEEKFFDATSAEEYSLDLEAHQARRCWTVESSQCPLRFVVSGEPRFSRLRNHLDSAVGDTSCFCGSRHNCPLLASTGGDSLTIRHGVMFASLF